MVCWQQVKDTQTRQNAWTRGFCGPPWFSSLTLLFLLLPKINTMTRLLTATLLSIITLSSCWNGIEGVGSATSEKRALIDFDEIVLDCSADVNIRQNLIKAKSSLEVVAQENLLPYILTKVENDVLTITIEESIMSTGKLEVNVTTNGLTRISIDGSGDIESENVLRFEDLRIDHDGSGDVTLDLKGEELDIRHDGSGDIQLEGSVDELDVTADGSGDLDAFDLSTKTADVSNDGSGDLNIHVKESLKVTNDGSGDVNYKGKPDEITQENNGSGAIKDQN